MTGEETKVSVIIPVYNGETYLKHCLDSLLAQSYSSWEAILVDDGSRDGSLSICQNYAALDSRFRVVSKPNGGVSSARNAGLALAQGDYLTFMDSDDCMATDALEKMVALTKSIGSQLVVMTFLDVNYDAPEQGDREPPACRWIPESPWIISQQEFQSRHMRLLLQTGLLESMCGKLYDRKLFQEHGLRCPENLSLGEDLVTNLRYYPLCSQITFLKDCGYYYNRTENADSLTQRYRPDLFEAKMYLIHRIEDYLGGREHLSPPEKAAFYSYAAHYGLTCVDSLVRRGGLSRPEQLAKAREMFEYPLFAESLRGAGYIAEPYVQVARLAQKGNVPAALRFIRWNVYERTGGLINPLLEPGLLRRIAKKIFP